MRRTRRFVSSTTSLRCEPNVDSDARFGKKSESTILIYISGNVTHPGKYYVPKGTGLKSVLGRAGGFTWTTHKNIENHGGRIVGTVSIFREGKRTQYSIAKLQLVQHEDIALNNDDTIDFHYRPFSTE